MFRRLRRHAHGTMNNIQSTSNEFRIVAQLLQDFIEDLDEMFEHIEKHGIDVELEKSGDINLMDIVTGKVDKLPFKINVNLGDKEEEK